MNIQKIIKEMTVQEKVAQLNQKLYGWEIYEVIDDEPVIQEWFKDYVKEQGAIGSIYGVLRADPFTKRNFDNGLSIANSKKIIKLISDYVASESKHNIRPMFVEETPHGHQGLNSTLYPTNIAIGATFNPDLYEKSLIELSEYMQMLNINIGLFSGLDIVRNPKWGRSEECFSEDPRLASSFVGKVSNSAKAERFTGCLKHFAAQADPYIGQNSGSVNIGEREMYELHLQSMKEHGKNTDMVMAAYNEIDGIPCHANRKLLTNILRDEFEFDGVVLSDGCALSRLVSENVSEAEAAKFALNAGVDLSLWDDIYEKLPAAVEAGVVEEDLIDIVVSRILKLKAKLGLIDTEIEVSNDLPTETNISLKLAEESIILAKNNNHLPINNNEKILLVGAGFESIYTMLGDYTSIQDEEKYPNVITAFKNYGYDIDFKSYEEVLNADVNKYAHAFVCCGGTSKRNFDMVFDSNGAILTTKSKEMECGENADVGNIRVKKLQENAVEYLTSKSIKTCAVFIQGRAYSMETVYDNANSIILAFYPGQYGAEALVKIISGEVNPSGKCPVSILKSSDYAGYAYNNKKDFRKDLYIDNDRAVAFPFGYGLSYSTFVYKDLKTRCEKDKLIVDVELENKSDIDGLEVVQVYVEKANTIITKRKCELIAFDKVSVESNSKYNVNFEIELEKLMTYNLEMKLELEKGQYKIYVGNGEERYLETTIEL